jgi:hypothetical protein
MFNNHAGRAALALITLTTPVLLRAQVGLYSYSESIETYTEITAGEAAYSLGTPTWWPPLHNERAWTNHPFYGADGQVSNYLNPATGPGYPIGFDFRFNGDVFDRISVSHSGFITFGKSSDGDQAVWCYAINHSHGAPFVQSIGGPSEPYKRNRVAGMGTSELRMQDMSSLVPPGPVSSLRLATIGTAPNRVFVVQFKDFRLSYSPSSTLINFQIRLNEADNAVEVRFGSTVFAFGGASTQIGLGGRTPEDFNSRMTVAEEPEFLYDWNNTVRGLLNTDFCTATAEEPQHPAFSAIAPALGLNFKWTPDDCPPPAWPLTVDQMSFDSGHASWEPTAAAEYEYYLTDTNYVGGPEITSGITSDPEVYFFGLEASTTYYLFVRGICDGEPGPWSMATSMETLGGGMVECDGTILTENYCSRQYDVKEWLYVSSDGSPLKIEFLGGFVGNVSGVESFQVWDGTSDAGTPAPNMSGDLTGHHFLASTNNALFIRLITDAGACEAQSWYLPLQWRVGCKACTDPLANFSVVDDCDNDRYFVEVNLFNLGSTTSVDLNNDQGVAPTTVSTTGVHTVGPFISGTPVVVTVQHPEQPMCYTASPALMGLPCAVVDCGPETYDLCYGDNEWFQRAYQSDGTQEIGIRFLAGTIGLGDRVTVYNGADPNEAPSTELTTLANTLMTSATPSTDRTLVLELFADGSHSCADEDPLFGTSVAWRYVVACYDGCTQPRATFTTVCVDQTHFNVEVNVTEIGSTSSVNITNDRGLPSVTATATGTYTVGPFTSGMPVTIEVEGASVLCSWTGAGLDRSCLGIGIEEAAMNTLRLFPNPNDGRFTLELSEDMLGSSQLQVLDLAGRVVEQQQFNGAAVQHLDLSGLPNGLYTLVLQNNGRFFNGKVSIQH